MHSTTPQEVIAVHGKSRRQFKSNKLRWCISGGKYLSLGWAPFKSYAARWVNGQVRFAGHFFRVWDSYGLSRYTSRAGNFSEDTRDCWYFNIVVEAPVKPVTGTNAIGIDLGLKETATCTDELRLECKSRFREIESQLGMPQRMKKRNRVKVLHASINNRRKDYNHKFSTKLIRENSAIFTGNESSAKLAQVHFKCRLASALVFFPELTKIAISFCCPEVNFGRRPPILPSRLAVSNPVFVAFPQHFPLKLSK